MRSYRIKNNFQNNNFYEAYYNVRNLVTSSNEYQYTQSFILKTLCPYIKKIQEENADKNIDELYTIIKEKSFDFAKTSFISTYAFDYYMDYVSCKYLQANPKLFDDIYEKLKKGELRVDSVKQNIHANNRFYDYLIKYIHNADLSFQEFSDFFADMEQKHPYLKCLKETDNLSFINKKNKAEDYINKQKNLSNFDKKKFKETLPWYFKGLKGFLKKEEVFLEKKLSLDLANSIASIASQLSFLNLFEKYKKIELLHFKKMHFDGFITDTKQIDITNPELLKDLPITNLMILNSFWMNRYAKELEAYANGMFAIESLDLLPDIINGTLSKFDIHKDKINGVLTKCKFLKPHIQEYIYNQQIAYYNNKLKKSDYTTNEEDHFIKFSFEPLESIINAKYTSNIGASRDYTKIFDEEFPYSDNDLKEDIKLYSNLLSPVVNIYDMKTETIQALLSTLSTLDALNTDKKDKKIVNAGIIPDSISKDGTKIFLNPNFVCIGFDANLTFPVREHLKLSALQEFLISLQNGQNYVPIYIGDKDFKFNKTTQTPNKEQINTNYTSSNSEEGIISAQRILPFSKEQEKYLKKFIQELQKKGYDTLSAKEISFIEHLNWLRDSSAVPEKYLIETTNEKGKKIRIFQHTYINISEYIGPETPLQIYTLSNEGQYIPVKSVNTQFHTSRTNISNKKIGGSEFEI